jgi:hypothetical protein
LAGAPEPVSRPASRRRFNISIGKNQYRPMAAQFQGNRFNTSGGTLGQQSTYRYRTGECHFANNR